MTLKKLKPIDTTTMHERAYQELRMALMSGVFKPGEVVTLRGVAEALGTSLMPAREAVRRLVSDHALEMPTARSIRVPLSSRAAFENLSCLRVVLEGHAAGCAAEHANARMVRELTKINAEILTCRSEGDMAGMLSANREFHMALYRASGNPLLVAMIENLWLLNGPYLNLLTDNRAAKDKALHFDEHEQVLRALRDGDADAASSAIRADIESAFALYRERIEALDRKQTVDRRK
jgi:DNA-binding GntR family transcriptional regulator